MNGPGRGRRVGGRGGYTLIEMAITLSLVGLILGSLTNVLTSSGNAYEQGAASANAQALVRRAGERLGQLLENAGSGTLLPNPVGIACSDLVFQAATGVDPATQAITYDNSARLRFLYESGELNNGLDDDGDGLVDEGSVEYTRNYLLASQRLVVLANGVTELLEGELLNGLDDNANGLVDEPGFSVTRVGNLLRVRISLAAPVGGAAAAVATSDTALRLKN
jgi:prepilin-type N-terminal cleavage/methylation domain-containing protein